MKTLLFLASIILNPSLLADEFSSDWQGSRRWIGPEFWASPIYDWETKDGAVIAQASSGRLLHLLTHDISEPKKGFKLSVKAEFLGADNLSQPHRAKAGFAIGVQAAMADPRHVAIWAKKRLNAVIRADGKLEIGKETISSEALPGKGSCLLELTYTGTRLTLSAERGGKTVSVSKEVLAEELVGNVCLSVDSPRKHGDRRGTIRARFQDWRVSGDGFTSNGVEPFGPILWSQYIRQGTKLTLSAQLPPVGETDSKHVTLQVRSEDTTWFELAKAEIDPLARTPIFRTQLPDAESEWSYRLLYDWNGKSHEWTGTIAQDPATTKTPLKIGVFSCDNGYAFPLPTLTRNAAIHQPNLLFFAGDQIYENYGGSGVIRQPLDKAMLDYLRKFYQFGWTWRMMLKDTPSIILPDDHDVFQGNIWGAGGRKTNKIEDGGYSMPAAWVKAVERTQTGHLPDPVDPKPIQQGIGVYFTQMTWGGVPIAILEDRKWKSGPNSILPKNRKSLTAEQTDVPGASLLGERQEAFLQSWSRQTQDAPLRLVLSQTIFCKGHTHTGPTLNKNQFDWDSNGWPRSGRQRALRPLMGNNTVMLHGDQHLGLMVRHGVDQHGDGPWAFMVPGTANGWPRAWWPESDRITGDFTDPFGNAFTVLAAGNPERGSNQLNPRKSDPPESTAHKKGSGYGMVTIQPDRSSAQFDLWRYDFNANSPTPDDQFDGFPVTLKFDQE